MFVEKNTEDRLWEDSVILLKQKGIDISVVTLWGRGILHDKLKTYGIPAFSLDAKTSVDYPGATVKLARLLRKEKFDLVKSCECIPATIGGIAGMWAPQGVRVFLRGHMKPENPGAWKQGFFSQIGSWTNHFVIACSEATKVAAQDLDGVPEHRVMVALLGIKKLRDVPSEELVEIRQRLGIPDNALIISMVSRLRTIKGHRTLFDSAEILSSRIDRPIHLVIVGDGTDANLIVKDSERVKAATVHFVGDQADVAPWFAVGDMVAMPSYREPFGLAAVEAMMSGKPLIASRVGGLTEIITDGVDGLLVEPDDAEALATAFIRISENPEFAAGLAHHARSTAEKKFTIEKTVDRWIDCYRCIVKSNVQI